MPLLVLLSLMSSTVVDIESLDMYQAYSIDSIFKIDEDFLLCSRAEHKLIKTDATGKPISVYSKKGKGPGELEYPHLMGVSEDKIFVFNTNGSIVELDHNLKNAKNATFPKFPFGTSFSKPILSGDLFPVYSYMFYAMGNEKLVAKHEIKNGKWVLTGGYFDQNMPKPSSRRKYPEASRIVFDGNIAFYVPKGYMESYYEILVCDFKDRTDDKVIAALAHEVDAHERNGFGNYLYFDRAAVWSGGFIVEMAYKENGEDKHIHDYFDRQGKFMKRMRMGDAKLIPVQNSDEVFLFRDLDDGPVLELFTPES